MSTRWEGGPFTEAEAPIARTSLAATVADHLREMITLGSLKSGDRVQVTALAATLGVSATPIREALLILAEDRLVELLPNRGARVLPYTAAEALALFAVMAALESLAARLAATQMRPAELDALEALHASMAAYHRHGDAEPYFALNTDIHAAILRSAENPELWATHARLALRSRRGRQIAMLDQARWDASMAEHEALMDALRRRDTEAAAAIWQLHLTNTGSAIARVLRDADSSD